MLNQIVCDLPPEHRLKCQTTERFTRSHSPTGFLIHRLIIFDNISNLFGFSVFVLLLLLKSNLISKMDAGSSWCRPAMYNSIPHDKLRLKLHALHAWLPSPFTSLMIAYCSCSEFRSHRQLRLYGTNHLCESNYHISYYKYTSLKKTYISYNYSQNSVYKFIIVDTVKQQIVCTTAVPAKFKLSSKDNLTIKVPDASKPVDTVAVLLN